MSIKSGAYGSSVDWVDLGLKTDPFPARPADPATQAVFAQQEVFSLCDTLQPLHVFTGIAGVGKSTHAKQLAKHFLKNKRRPTQIITASKTIKASGLLKMICCRFNVELPPGDLVDAAKTDNIRRMILKRKEAVALIIDDAQNLSQDALGAVVRLTALQQAPLKLQVVLFGMPILLDRVRKTWGENAAQGDFSQGMIRSWGHNQTEAYIISRLQESGIASSRKVCRKVCQKIHQLSGGVPMQINRRANMMLDQLIKGHVSQERAIPTKGSMLWMGALFAASTAALFSYQAMSKPGPEHMWMAEDAPESLLAMNGEAVGDTSMLALEADALEEALTQPEEILMDDLEDAPKMQAVDDSLDQILTASIGDSHESAAAVDIAESQDQTTGPEASEQSVSSELMTDSAVIEDWLSKNSGYTVQVLATTDESEAFRVAKRYDHARVVHAARQNKEKYLVVVGEFDTISTAKSHASEIENDHDGSLTWVRSIKQIRSDVDSLEAMR